MRVQEFDFSIDLLQALLWRFNEAEVLQSLLTQKQEWYDLNQTAFWDAWFVDVFDLRTANEFGLTVWSIILDLPLFVPATPDPINKPIWGFGEFHKNFNRGVFATTVSNPSDLTKEERRLLLRLRAFQLFSRCAIPEINKFLRYLFGIEEKTYLLDGFEMFIVLIFDWPANPKLVENIIKYDLIPRGAGVLLKVKVDPRSAFGFGPHHRNFNRGTFAREF